MAGRRGTRRLVGLLVALLVAVCGYIYRAPLYDAATAQWAEGQVIRVIDGDTFEVLYKGDPDKVRIANIDAWELKDPGGPQAKAYLRRLIEGKVVQLKTDRARLRDRYGRLLARVYLDQLDVGQEMIDRGHARPWE